MLSRKTIANDRASTDFDILVRFSNAVFEFLHDQVQVALGPPCYRLVKTYCC